MLQLSIQDFEGKATTVPLADGELTIGRDESNAICLTERNVSRHQARILVQGDQASIEPLRATWGTRLNQHLLRARVELRPGDVIQIGDYTLELLSGTSGGRRDTALVDDSSGGSGPSSPPRHGAPDNKGAVDNRTSIVNLADIQLATSAPGESTPIAAAEQPRLVVESDNLRGLELRVTRSPTTIGRVAESADLVVDHRSISKEHARLTRKPDGTWEVLDLGSSNGIQINGEPYSKSAIRSGDVLILGHVALRFLGPGAATPARAAGGGGGGGKGLVVAAIIVTLLLAGGLAAFLLTGGGDKPVPEAPANEGKGPANNGGGQAVVAAGEGHVEEAPEGVDVADKIRQIEKMRVAGMVREALALARETQKSADGKPELALLVRKLEAELEAIDKITAAEKIVDDDPKQAVDAINDLGDSLEEGSALRKRADALLAKARTMLVANLLDEAEKLLKRKEAGEALAKAELAQEYAPGNEDAAKLVVKARAMLKETGEPEPAVERPAAKVKPDARPRVETAPKPKPKPTAEVPAPKPAPTPVEADPAPKPKPAGDMSAQEHYNAGRTAGAADDKQGAIQHFQSAVKLGFKKAHGQLARLYFQMGDKGNCAKHGNLYVQMYPDAADAQAIEGMLEKCR